MSDNETVVACTVWPEAWTDRGSVRRFDDAKNYPEGCDGIIYARQVAELLSYPIERVLKYPMLQGPDGQTLPDWWQRDRYGSQYCSEEQADRIVERIRYHRNSDPRRRTPTTRTPDEKASRRRKLAQLRQNSEMMLRYFVVVTPGHNAAFLDRLGLSAAEAIEPDQVDAVLRGENIRLVRLDNPERWTDAEDVTPKKFMALHPSDVTSAIKALKRSFGKAGTRFHEAERAERATVIWLPAKGNGWQHPDPDRTVYPPRIERLALCHSSARRSELQPGWAILRGWGAELDELTEPINGCEVDFVDCPDKGRYEAMLSPDDVEEILL